MEFNEIHYQNYLIKRLENLGWNRANFFSQSRGIFIKEILQGSLKKINGIDDKITKLVFEKIKETIETNSSLFEINKVFHTYLKNGFNLSNGGDIPIKLLDPVQENNVFHYCSEFSTEYNCQDIVLFVNGLPLIIIECKSPFQNENQIEYAFQQVKIYQKETAYLFYFNLFSILTNKYITKYGTITASNLREFWWWREDIGELLHPSTVLDLLKSFVYFNKEEKIIAQNHQYVAAKKFYQQLLKEENKKGIIQHSQGAGKSILMIFLVKQIINFSSNSTILIITDRNQLDDQIYKKFSWARDFLFNWELHKIESRKNLEETIKNKKQGGIIFHTLQKIKKNIIEPWDTRKNIYIIVDEAHRSWYGEKAKLVAAEDSTYEERYGLANWIFRALPGANRLGVTATPIEQNDRSTRGVFGEVIHVYDRDQSVEDDITVGLIYYDRIIVPLEIKEESDWKKFSESKREDIICNQSRLREVAKRFYQHYMEMRKNKDELENDLLVSHKALFVTSSRKHALKIYQLLLEKTEENQITKEEICLDVTISKNSPLDSEIKGVIKSKEKQKREFYNFQNEENPKIMIVVDKYTTGFDMPKLQLIYIDKYINQFHSLEQTIMRVNRRYSEKSIGKKDKGIIVDFIGLGKNMEKISTVIKYENITEQVKQKLTEIEQELPLEKFSNWEEAENILESETKRSLLKEKARSFKSLYKYGQNHLTKEQKKKMKGYISIDKYLSNIEKTKNLKNEDEENLKGGFSSLDLAIGKREKNYSDPVKIDKLLEEVKKLHKSYAKTIFLYSLWGSIQPSLRDLGSVVNKVWREKVAELLTKYNNYEDLATSLQRIIEEARDKLQELNKDSSKKESYPFLQLLHNEKSISQEGEKNKVSKKIAEEIKNSGDKNIDWMRKESNKAKFTNNLRLLLCQYFPKIKRENLINNILQEIEFINCPEKPISNKSEFII